MFDLTINLGHILNILALLLGGGILAGTLRTRLSIVEAEMKKVSEILIDVARQDVRLDFIDKRLEELKDRLESR